MDLDEFRSRINDLDERILKLLNQRAEAALRIGELKRRQDLPYFVPEREAEIVRLMEAYLSLATFPEVAGALRTLAGTPLGILSNGSPMMLAAAVSSGGLEGQLAHVLSVDAVKTYKPMPAVYELGPRAFGAAARDILFVSSNAWDVAGAKAFGYRTCWCNRARAPMDNLGVAPDLEVTRLEEIASKLS